jgi:hypothetical protein
VPVLINAKSVPRVSSGVNHCVSPSARRESSSWMVPASHAIKSVSRVSVPKITNATHVQIIRRLDWATITIVISAWKTVQLVSTQIISKRFANFAKLYAHLALVGTSARPALKVLTS